MMGKELSEMTLEELWDLFPIFLDVIDGMLVKKLI